VPGSSLGGSRCSINSGWAILVAGCPAEIPPGGCTKGGCTKGGSQRSALDPIMGEPAHEVRQRFLLGESLTSFRSRTSVTCGPSRPNQVTNDEAKAAKKRCTAGLPGVSCAALQADSSYLLFVSGYEDLVTLERPSLRRRMGLRFSLQIIGCLHCSSGSPLRRQGARMMSVSKCSRD
jgi:hypothetical protein